jgi:alkanesulfonate monooxygenase SsuD/methylene tetrahydromethanopterin reductase-like flavin-dependent oxidoreductase (luciferase family)
VRIARLAESITILKGLFAPGPFTFQGEHYQVTDLDGMPKPPQGASLPFLVGGGGKKILGLAAREAKIVGINANLKTGEGESRETAQSLLPAATDQKLAWLREAAGPGFADLEIQTLLGFVHVTDDPSGIAKAMAGSFGVSEADAVLAPATLVGSVESIIELLEERRERWQMSYIVVPIESTETLAPVVARLAGK